MATLIAGDRNQMIGQMYGTMSENTINYLYNKIDNVAQTFQSIGTGFNDYANEVVNRFKRGAVNIVNTAKSIVGATKNIFNNNIYYINTEFDFRTCSPINQQFIYCHPYFQNEIDNRRLDGWSDTRVDDFPGLIGEHNPLYQSATNGVLQYSDEHLDGIERTDKIIHYLDYGDSKELKFHEQLVIRSNWENLFRMTTINDEDDVLVDPTSIYTRYID